MEIASTTGNFYLTPPHILARLIREFLFDPPTHPG
eukprot:UN24188